MFEILSGGLLGSIFGGLFRLAPEVLKFFDKKNEREHEMAMFSRQCDHQDCATPLKQALDARPGKSEPCRQRIIRPEKALKR